MEEIKMTLIYVKIKNQFLNKKSFIFLHIYIYLRIHRRRNMDLETNIYLENLKINCDFLEGKFMKFSKEYAK